MGRWHRQKRSRDGDSADRRATERSRSRHHIQEHTWEALSSVLQSLDGSNYGAYNELRGQGFRHDKPGFLLTADSIQGDAYAPPSRFRVVLDASSAKLPPTILSTKSRRVSVADFFARRFVNATQACEADVRQGGGGWRGLKGGDLSMECPSQHVLERTNVVVHEDGSIEARFTIGLPARGRTISGQFAKEILVNTVPKLIWHGLICPGDPIELFAHVESVEDQNALRSMLSSQNLVAFVADGAILPRESGHLDTPLGCPPAKPFQSPESLIQTFTLPHRGPISGLAIPKGITVIVGGGYHGKSTLLNALEVGMYNHIPGDGREFVVADPCTVKIRAEDGRNVVSCDVSPFISDLPTGQTTTDFSSTNASGSTSQAANIMEALEAGATTLLMDEDTCATNFMIRDRKIQLLVAKNKEPISPFLTKAQALYNDLGISSILVVGGAGDYFSIADTVIMMDAFEPKDVTRQAKEIACQHQPIQVDTAFLVSPCQQRVPLLRGFQANGRVRTKGLDHISYGEVDIDLSAVFHLVESGQVRAIADIMEKVLTRQIDDRKPLKELLDFVDETLNSSMDAIDDRELYGWFSRPRRFEVNHFTTTES
ncbi:hypothetical protein AeRB84_001635 [Aphanomyces euteiches]|nr:hypothetical protein AeRB84_001635 [Aphanomyces euteiches]